MSRQENQIRQITIQDQQYPTLLKEIHDPPSSLFYRGTLPPQDTLCLGVVGARKMSSYGKEVCRALVEPLARAGVCIVSGLAYGIDAEAHKAALKVGGHTVAVLAGGIDQGTIYPRAHRPLAAKVIESGGALISEHPEGTEYKKHHFPIRNRIIAGICRAVLVIEASIKSGTLITARCAVAENREVLAVPGNITSELSQGPHLLIQDGAIPVFTPGDIFEALNIQRVNTKT